MKNPMESKPVFPLLMSMAVPPMVSMLIQSMYNIVDSLFVARISEQALTAVSLAYSVQNLLIGVAVGTGVGVNSCCPGIWGTKPGRRQQDSCKRDFIMLVTICSSWCLGCFSPGRFSNYRQIQKKS